MQVRQSKFLVLLTPSLVSVVTSVMLSLAIILIIVLVHKGGEGSLYDYLFGPSSSAEYIASSKSTLSALNNTVLGNTTLNKVLYFAFWMLIGLVVYIILYVVLRGTGFAAEELREIGFTNIKKAKLLEDFAIRSSVRLAAFLSWVVFTILFFKVLLPFCSLAVRNAANDLLSIEGLLYLLYSFVVLMLSLHVEVVLVRFMLLRVRILSQQEVDS